jgi:hypothetical protein
MKITKIALITLVPFLSSSFAQETEVSMESREKVLVAALDSIEENAVGFALNGRAKGGMLSSILKSDALPDSRSVSEHLMFTDFLLGISVRPSNETKATFDLRFHKDWQSAYREGNNSPVIRWWSYDGNILNKKLKFNLGTMRLAYTPLTIYLPEPEFIMEPEIFASLKKEAMEERYLDGTKRRLLQGLNAEYRISAGIFDNILLQGTLLRLKRNDAKEISYDFDPFNDRYSTAARVGFELFGLSLGANDVYTFDRVSSSIKVGDSLNNEKNNVLSFELSYDSKKLLSGPLNFGVGTEYALSRWQHGVYGKIPVVETELRFEGTDSLIPSNTLPGASGTEFYPRYVETTSKKAEYKFSRRETQFNKGAFIANAFVAFNQRPFEAKLSGHFLNIDENFEAELAMSPAYLPNLPILNSHADLTSSAFEKFRSGSLENMYYSLYYSMPMNAITIVSGVQGQQDVIVEDEIYKSKNLYNNYKFSQYYNNAYNAQTFTRLERDSIINRLDPAVNLALPFGYATPDRTGGDADLNFVWNKAVSIRGVFGKYSSKNGGDYTRLGGGLEIDIAHLADLSKALSISGSYEQNKEEKGEFNPQTDRIMAGAKVGIWRGLSLIGGFQQLGKKFKNPYMGIIDKTSEMLLIGGPQVKISEGADFSLQGGLLSNLIEGAGTKLELDKYVLSGIATVKF